MNATAVIGACWGDEGKGLVTDFLAAKNAANTIIIRFNGGGQAGHTVQRPDGRRHSFSHVGAGTFAGAATFLSRYFVVNPLLWQKEREVLAHHEASYQTETPPLWVDPTALFTTPYDMLVNQEFERHRGAARHGSCGYGINETVTRSETLPGHIGKADSVVWLRDFLRVARDYSLARVKTEVAHPSDLFMERLHSEGVTEVFIAAMEAFLKVAFFTVDIPKRYTTIIFEGAQGLLLDEKHEFFPHVTRSRTGLTNVVTLCRRNQIRELDVTYVSRAYMTRHGAGPFPTEDHAMNFADAANIPGEWQGALRFGALDTELIGLAVWRDIEAARRHGLSLRPFLAVTCLDQVDATAGAAACKTLTDAAGLAVLYRSYGPCREDVMDGIASGTYTVAAQVAEKR